MKVIFNILLLLLATAFVGWTEDFGCEALGIRGGTSLTGSSHEFLEGDLFASWRLPARWHPSENWSIRPLFDFSIGELMQHRNNCFIGNLGPSLVIERKDFPLFLVGGIGPTFIGRTRFEKDDFGTRLQFTEHANLFWEPIRHLIVGYRFQHMSNAGFGRHNPGLNLHMLVLGYQF
jgi:hypothetical protein